MSVKGRKHTPRFSRARVVVFACLCLLLVLSLPLSPQVEKLFQTLSSSAGLTSYQLALEKELVVHFVDVGHADCIILQLPDGKVGMVDGGDNTNQSKTHIVEYARTNIFKAETGTFDFMIVTHSHQDHIGSMGVIFNNFQIDKVYRPKIFYTTGSGGSVTPEQQDMAEDELQRAKDAGLAAADATSLSGQPVTTENSNIYFEFLVAAHSEPGCDFEYTAAGLELGNSEVGYSLTFYSPNKEKYSNVNNFSPVLVLSYKEHSIMLSGDAEKAVEQEVLELYTLPKVDAIKLGHHGSSTSTTLEFLTALSPDYIFITEKGKYGHPTPEVMARLSEFGIEDENIFRTSLHGDMLFAVDGDGLYVAVENNSGSLAVLKWWHIVAGLVVLSGILIFSLPTRKTRIKLVDK